MFRKALFAVALCVLIGMKASADMPKEIKSNYDGVLASLKALDAKKFGAFFSKTFVNVDPKGKKVKLPEYIKSMEELFSAAKSADCKAPKLEGKEEKGTVAVKCDVTMVFTMKDGSKMQIHEVCTDYWHKEKGKWLIYKTVDTVNDTKVTGLKKKA